MILAQKKDKGDRSLNRDTGTWGPKGDAGEQRPPGSGCAGSQGPKGDKRDNAAQGPTGDIGPEDPKGHKGDTSPQGPKGDEDDIGFRGRKGDKGDTGAQEPKGDKGDTGPQAPSFSSDSADLSTVFLWPGTQIMTGNLHMNSKYVIKKDAFCLVTSTGQRKNFKSPQGIEPQTFGLRAPLLYHWATETPQWSRSITKFKWHASGILLG